MGNEASAPIQIVHPAAGTEQEVKQAATNVHNARKAGHVTLWCPIVRKQNSIEVLRDAVPEVKIMFDPRDNVLSPVVKATFHSILDPVEGATVEEETFGVTEGLPHSAAGPVKPPQLFFKWDNRWNKLASPWSVKDLRSQTGVRAKTIESRIRKLCLSGQQPKLLNHQEDVLLHFELNPHLYGRQPRDVPKRERGFLLLWSMGSGKTRAASEVVGLGAPTRVIVVAHKTNLGQWEATLKGLYQRAGTWTHFVIVGHTEFARRSANENFVRNAVVILDEMQVYRSLTPAMQYPVSEIRNANQVLCLTGTPLVNGPDDMAGFLRLMGGMRLDEIDQWFKRYDRSGPEHTSAITSVTRAVMRRVSFHDPRVHDPEGFTKHYPTIGEHYVGVALTWMQTMLHQVEETAEVVVYGKKVPLVTHNSYHTHTRHVMNTGGHYPVARLRQLATRGPTAGSSAAPVPSHSSRGSVSDGRAEDGSSVYEDLTSGAGEELEQSETGSPGKDVETMSDVDLLRTIERDSPKVRKIVKGLEQYYPAPQVVHSHFVEHGAYLVAAVLRWKHPKWKVEMITGATEGEERTHLVNAYNSGKIHVLIITDASATGTDVHGTRAMWKMGLADNLSTERQTTGRVARFGSHKQGDDLTISTTIATFGAKLTRGYVPHHIREDVRSIVEHMADMHRRGVAKTIRERGGVDVDDVLVQLGLLPDEDGRVATETFEEKLLREVHEKQAALDELMHAIRAAAIPPLTPAKESTRRNTQAKRNSQKVASKRGRPRAAANKTPDAKKYRAHQL